MKIMNIWTISDKDKRTTSSATTRKLHTFVTIFIVARTIWKRVDTCEKSLSIQFHSKWITGSSFLPIRRGATFMCTRAKKWLEKIRSKSIIMRIILISLFHLDQNQRNLSLKVKKRRSILFQNFQNKSKMWWLRRNDSANVLPLLRSRRILIATMLTENIRM